MRRTPVNDCLEDISTELPEEIYGYLSDAIYETVCGFDEEVDQLKAENAKLRELARGMYGILATFDVIIGNHDACETPRPLIFGEDKSFKDVMRELGVEVDGC